MSEPPRHDPAASPAPKRQGPRPMALHLWLTMAGLTSACTALPALRNGSPLWNPVSASDGGLAAALAGAEPAALHSAVATAARGRLAAFLAGIDAYRNHPYERAEPEVPLAWSAGSARLYDHGARKGGSGGPVALLVPSLINRSYVLDLTPARSLTRYLAARGVRPLLLDWGAPGAEERDFTLTDYIEQRLEPALATARDLAGGPVALVGYCMGGLFTLALALRRPDAVAGSTFLATPWDFHADDPARAKACAAAAAPWLPLFDTTGGMPVDVIQTLFASLDPFLAGRKFAHFAGLDPASGEAEHFVALEDWLNDGVPLVPQVARETLVDWYGDNLPGAGRWEIGGRAVLPGDHAAPALVIVPDADKIVPPPSAMALARALPDAEIRIARTGHIGMVTGSRAERDVWAPLAEWILRTAAPA